MNKDNTKFLTLQKGDDPIFLENCEKIIQHQIKYWKPKELFIISANIFFNKVSVEDKNFGEIDEIFSFWSCGDELTVTRLHPQIYEPSTKVFLRFYKGYEEKTHASYIKKRKKEEYRKYVNHYGPDHYSYKPIDDGLIIYYSTQTISKDCGTIMFYQRSQAEFNTILVELRKDNNWNISESHGVEKAEIQKVIDSELIPQKSIIVKLDT